jgi:hypothetical protein
LNHPSEKKRLEIKEPEHVLSGKVGQLFRAMLQTGDKKENARWREEDPAGVLARESREQALAANPAASAEERDHLKTRCNRH